MQCTQSSGGGHQRVTAGKGGLQDLTQWRSCGCPATGNNGTSRIVKCDAGGYQLGLGMLPPNIPLGCPRNRFLFGIRDAAEAWLAANSCLIFQHPPQVAAAPEDGGAQLADDNQPF